ncbi:hypothetical protein [Nocardia thraciensis]
MDVAQVLREAVTEMTRRICQRADNIEQDTEHREMEPDTAERGRLAIRCIRPDLTNDRDGDELRATQVGVRLGYAVDEAVVVLDPSCEGPLVTVVNALARTGADAVIVPDLLHVIGIDSAIRLRVDLITADDGAVLERQISSVECRGLGIVASPEPA